MSSTAPLKLAVSVYIDMSQWLWAARLEPAQYAGSFSLRTKRRSGLILKCWDNLKSNIRNLVPYNKNNSNFCKFRPPTETNSDHLQNQVWAWNQDFSHIAFNVEVDWLFVTPKLRYPTACRGPSPSRSVLKRQDLHGRSRECSHTSVRFRVLCLSLEVQKELKCPRSILPLKSSSVHIRWK